MLLASTAVQKNQHSLSLLIMNPMTHWYFNKMLFRDVNRNFSRNCAAFPCFKFLAERLTYLSIVKAIMRQKLNARSREGEFNILNSQCWWKEKKVVWMHHIPTKKKKKILEDNYKKKLLPGEFCIKSQLHCGHHSRKLLFYLLVWIFIWEYRQPCKREKPLLKWQHLAGCLQIPWKLDKGRGDPLIRVCVFHSLMPWCKS